MVQLALAGAESAWTAQALLSLTSARTEGRLRRGGIRREEAGGIQKPAKPDDEALRIVVVSM